MIVRKDESIFIVLRKIDKKKYKMKIGKNKRHALINKRSESVSSDSLGELEISGHDGDSFSMDGT